MSSSSEDDPNIDPEVRFIMEGIARLVAKHGLWMESRFLEDNVNNKLYNFLRIPNHPYLAFYRNKIVEYRNAHQKQCIKPPCSTNYVAQPPVVEIKCPEGMKPNDFGVIKLTAHFVVRYGRHFWPDLVNSVTMNPKPQFAFINASDCRFNVLLELVDACATGSGQRVNLTNMLAKKHFSKGEDQQLTSHGCFSSTPTQMRPCLPVPLPKGSQWRFLLHHCHYVRNQSQRDKLNKSALVPEDQFLVQHSGSVTIRVSFPNVNSEQVTEITLQSLSENVASLKEKIARKIQIPANKQKLWGKAGFLKKDNMSLAHYCVGAGETLIMSLPGFNFVFDWQIVLNIFSVAFPWENLLLMSKLNLYSTASTCFLGAAFAFPDMGGLSLVFVF
ncbi:unnamed protein product [Brassica oleracea var. botrytis]